MNKAMKWIDDVRGADSIREVARRADLNQATLNRQVNLDQLTFETVRDVARAYGRPVLADLIATGYLSIEDAGIDGIERALQAASEAQLVLEVSRRLDVTPAMIWEQPISVAVETAARVTSLEERRAQVNGTHVVDERTNVDDLDAVASTTEADHNDNDSGFEGA